MTAPMGWLVSIIEKGFLAIFLFLEIFPKSWYNGGKQQGGNGMDGLNPFDQAIMAGVQQACHNLVTDTVFPVITYLGEKGLFWIALALGLVIFGKKRGWRQWGVLMLAAMAAGLLVGELGMKNLVCRPRPFQDYPGFAQLLIPPPSGFSFPSGHTCASFGAATVIFWKDRRWGGGALGLAALIGFSRVFLFVHYPTDVLAGALLGVLCGLGAVALGKRLFAGSWRAWLGGK